MVHARLAGQIYAPRLGAYLESELAVSHFGPWPNPTFPVLLLRGGTRSLALLTCLLRAA